MSEAEALASSPAWAPGLGSCAGPLLTCPPPDLEETRVFSSLKPSWAFLTHTACCSPQLTLAEPSPPHCLPVSCQTPSYLKGAFPGLLKHTHLPWFITKLFWGRLLKVTVSLIPCGHPCPLLPDSPQLPAGSQHTHRPVKSQHAPATSGPTVNCDSQAFVMRTRLGLNLQAPVNRGGLPSPRAQNTFSP